MIATLMAWRHRVRMSDRGRTRVLDVAGGARWHRQQQLWSSLLHALIHAVDTVHSGTAGTKIRQVKERTEAYDTERHEYQKDQVLLARTEGPSREQRHRYAVRKALVRRQYASRRAHLTTTHRHTCNAPRHLITTPILSDTRKLEHPCAFRTRDSSAVIRHYESSTTCVEQLTSHDCCRSADQLTWRAFETAQRQVAACLSLFIRYSNAGDICQREGSDLPSINVRELRISLS